MWWYILIIPVLGKLKQEDCHKFVENLGHIVDVTMKPIILYN